MRTSVIYTVENPEEFKNRMLAWAQQFREILYLDSNKHTEKYEEYDAVLAADAFTSIQTDHENAFEALNAYQKSCEDWIFGYLSYDLKNDTEKLTSNNFDGLGFDDLFFFQPKKLFLLKGNELQMLYLNVCSDEMGTDFKAIQNYTVVTKNTTSKIEITQRINKSLYIEKVDKVMKHITRGDIYEANFCMEFFAEKSQINPLETYAGLNKISAPPFACYLKNYDRYLLCASPERYLKKQGEKIISQPIKGTAARSSNEEQDESNRQMLLNNEKERSENIMIVDLVRNDLSRTAQKKSVEVEELCGIYSFKQVHQLISTITAKAKEGTTPVEILKTTFPMGSMTGAPKISAMKIIEEVEETKRGLYSGAAGYFKPDGDFDFNVVIRSILYNEAKQYVSFSVGSAITAKSIPEQEYEECLLKAAAMRSML